MVRRFLALGPIVGILLAPSEGLGATPCCDGDCNGNAAVKIDELILLVDIALGGETVGACQYGVCPCSGPDPGEICEITAVVRAVDAALYGCPQ